MRTLETGLGQGGLFVLDDLHLRSVTVGLVEFLDADPRWDQVTRKAKRAAWHRRSSGSLAEECTAQPFFSPYKRRP
jgi:hypothetical protein